MSLLATLLLLWALNTSFGQIPPLGKLLNPATGVWANAEWQYTGSQTVELPAAKLSGPVKVYYDRHRIPHIFASNKRDLYFAQGFVTARDRLWQMEFQTHAAAGRLSEIIGERALEYDRYRRRIGMVYAAENSLKGMMNDETTREVLQAYSEGVNAWIEHLSPADYPLEYKILDYKPETWSPLKNALLLKYMTYTLAGSNGDLRMSNTRAYFGDDFIEAVLDRTPKLTDPIIPPTKSWHFTPIDTQKPEGDFRPDIVKEVSPFQPDPANGSNNWAVSGRKTAGGYPILANDPHLDMTLPSIWYALQLHGPDQNVMGVTLPGTPSVIIGFNEQAAWGSTNVSADVWDWYEIQFRDSTLAEYRYDGSWRKTNKRIEKIKVRGAETVADTVIYTHHGPVVETGGQGYSSNTPRLHAMRWIAYEQSNELLHFLKLNRAQNYEDYRDAIRHYDNPAQNWVFADRSDIAITVTGKYPLKWQEQGRYISDGSDPLYEWQGWIPFEQIPSIKNPERGFVSSANQEPVGTTYPYYLDDNFAPFERGRRINDRLAAMEDITPSDMQQLQLDNYSYHAETALPLMLDLLHTDSLTGDKARYHRMLDEWEYENRGEEIAPSLFHTWWGQLYRAIWNDEYGSTDLPLTWPDRDHVVQLIRDNPEFEWVDDINTPEKETLADLVNRSFREAIQKLNDEYGSDESGWQWGYVNDTDINHLAQIPGLGRENIFTDGGGESVNAIRGGNGPSWRMVVELGPEVRGYGLYPGGQSGNAGSKYYDNMIDDWRKGKLYPLKFMRSAPAKQDTIPFTLTIQ